MNKDFANCAQCPIEVGSAYSVHLLFPLSQEVEQVHHNMTADHTQPNREHW
ncbi:hypothetical protein ACFL27_15135 [candidate division CSSED10-310 bacterium]|uniref:Uncharacterized protein n=1 Tax=candidate division CSSED10-310 bacterium TaxID=2855610 RepID=A0ABV6YZB7_UNCC1